MNMTALDQIIDRYAAEMGNLYHNIKSNEIFKWKAMKTFQREWFSDAHPDFITRFNAATKDFFLLIDNSRMHPRNGIVKLHEKEPAEVERLFCDVLFADDGGDIELRQIHMENFLTGIENLRQKYFPGNWSFKVDRHAASVFLAMYSPAENYIYKYGEAATLSTYTEFEQPLGAGGSFSLKNYYRMCDEIVTRLQAREDFLEKHFSLLTEECYEDRSLHLLAFDIMFCAKAFHFYSGMTRPIAKFAKGAKGEKNKAPQIPEEVIRRNMETLSAEIDELRLQLPDISDIDLMNVEVFSARYGTGMIIGQEENKIEVRFADTVKSFTLDRKFAQRPTFENDAEVVEVFSEYAVIKEKIEELEKELAGLSKVYESL